MRRAELSGRAAAGGPGFCGPEGGTPESLAATDTRNKIRRGAVVILKRIVTEGIGRGWPCGAMLN